MKCVMEAYNGGTRLMDEERYRGLAVGTPDAADAAEREDEVRRRTKQRSWHQGWASCWELTPAERAAATAKEVQAACSAADELIGSLAFAVAMAHVCSLEPRVQWESGAPPTDVLEWDRKALSHDNYFYSPGIALDPGNITMATAFLLLLMRAGLEPYVPDALLVAEAGRPFKPAKPTYPVGLSPAERNCPDHPTIGAIGRGLGGKAGPRCALGTMLAEDIGVSDSLRMVLATLLSHEPAQGVDLVHGLGARACERNADIIEAVGAVLAPCDASVGRLRAVLHAEYKYGATDDTNADRALTALVSSAARKAPVAGACGFGPGSLGPRDDQARGRGRLGEDGRLEEGRRAGMVHEEHRRHERLSEVPNLPGEDKPWNAPRRACRGCGPSLAGLEAWCGSRRWRS